MDVAMFHHYFDAIVSALALFFNFSLLYLILKHGTLKMREYKWVLLVMCASDICLAGIVFVSQPAILPKGGYIMMVTNGWFANQNELFDHVTLALYCAFLHTNIISIVVQFVYRYRIICRDGSQNSGFCFLYLCPVLWCGLQVYNAFCCFVLGSTPESREVGLGILQDIGWNYDPTEPPYPSVAHWTEVRTKVHHLMYLVSTMGGYSLIIMCQYRIMKYMAHHGSSMHETARQRHAYINKALVAMAIAPLMSSTGPSLTIISLMISHQSPGSVTAFITLGTSLITLINPLTTIYFVRPFRDAVFAAFSIGKAKVASVNATSDGATGSNDALGLSEP